MAALLRAEAPEDLEDVDNKGFQMPRWERMHGDFTAEAVAGAVRSIHAAVQHPALGASATLQKAQLSQLRQRMVATGDTFCLGVQMFEVVELLRAYAGTAGIKSTALAALTGEVLAAMAHPHPMRRASARDALDLAVRWVRRFRPHDWDRVEGNPRLVAALAGARGFGDEASLSKL